MLEALPRPLPGHLHKTQVRERVDRSLRPVLGERELQALQHPLAVILARHVNEVDDDDAAQVPEAQLPRNGRGGLDIGVEDRLLQAPVPDKRAGVDVDGRHGLGLVDYQRAS